MRELLFLLHLHTACKSTQRHTQSSNLMGAVYPYEVAGAWN